MKQSFIVGLACCLLLLGILHVAVAYLYWLSTAAAVATVFVWVSGLLLLTSWQEKPRLIASLSLLLHAGAIIISLSGMVFIVPEPTISNDKIPWLLGKSIIVLGILMVCQGYVRRKNEQKLLPLFVYLIWINACWQALLVAILWAEAALDSGWSLVVFGIQLVLSIEAGLRTIRNIPRVWQGEELPSQWSVRQLGFQWFFSRWNPISSVFDSLEAFFGIDIKGTWAIVFVRRALEPRSFFILSMLWLTSSVVSIDTHEQGVRERFGVPQAEVLEAGVHLVLPWPMGRIQRAPSHRILQMSIGHETEETEEGDELDEEESILWANQHAEEEFTLLLGDGRDLISADGVLQYKIIDLHAYLYSVQNPEDLLRSVTYRVLMHETASRTLEQALSENLNQLAARVTERIREEIERTDIGIRPVIFSFSALHPPVAVAEDYQQVISAQIDRDTRIIRAESYNIKRLQSAAAEQYRAQNKSQEESRKRIATAIGEAQSFEVLRQTVRQNEELYIFRRRQEALQRNLKGRDLFIIDHRLEQEGAQLWIQE